LGVAGEEVLDLVSGLVEKSLVEVVEHGSHVRYRLLESVRGYASERLVARGEQTEMGRRHADYFADLVAVAEPHFTVPGRRQWIVRLSSPCSGPAKASGQPSAWL
jgi:non-specific serine/threonine protein kinase